MKKLIILLILLIICSNSYGWGFRKNRNETLITGTSTTTSQSNEFSATAPVNCALSLVCPQSKKEKLWGQTRVDADLMNSFITANHLREARIKTPVIVIDTGFDISQSKNMQNPEKLLVEPGVYGWLVPGREKKLGDPDRDPVAEGSVSLVGPPTEDDVGHGTLVASVIGGKDGIGVAPRAEISVYRINEAKKENTTDEFISYAIHRACRVAKQKDPQSVPVINISWGGRADEMGKTRDENTDKKLLEYLAAEGCLVTKAAGNSSFRLKDDAVNGSLLDDPYLRVGATEPFSQLAAFSSNGEVSAPGEDIFALESTKTEIHSTSTQQCGEEKFDVDHPPKRFVNGTSFSAPLTAGIASELIGVLRTGSRLGSVPGPSRISKFDGLSNPDKIALVNRILRASTFAGTINGFRAVLIAERWNNLVTGNTRSSGTSSSNTNSPGTNSYGLLSVDQLSRLLTESVPPFCTGLRAPCDPQTCSVYRDCFERTRMAAAACPLPIESVSRLTGMATTAHSFETATKYYHVLKELGASGSLLGQHLRKIVDGFLSQWTFDTWMNTNGELTERNMNDDMNIVGLRHAFGTSFGQEILPEYMNYAFNSGDHRLETFAIGLVRGFFESSALTLDLAKGQDRGSEEILAVTMNSLKQVRQRMAPPKFSALLSEYFEGHLGDINTRFDFMASEPLVAMVRMLDALYADPEYSPYSDVLQKYDSAAFSILDNVRYNFPRNTQSQIILFEVQATRPYFDLLMARHLADIRKFLREKSFSQVGPSKIAYVFDHLDAVLGSPTEQMEFAEKVKANLEAELWRNYKSEFVSQIARFQKLQKK